MVGIRRENAGSEDSGYTSQDGRPVTIEEWVSKKDKYRVVSDGIPMPFPWRMIKGNPELEDFFDEVVEPALRDLLKGFHISCHVARLSHCYPPHNKSEAKYVAVIHSRDTETKSWFMAARAIQLLFFNKGGKDFVDRLQVEIRNPLKMYCDSSKILPDDPALLDALAQIEDDVFKIVRNLLGGVWSSIAYHTRYNRRISDSPQKTTLMVFCYPGTSSDFEKVEGEIAQALETVPAQIHLEFLPGQITNLASGDPLVLSPSIPRKPINGSSIGINGKAGEAGTLGGWVYLNLPGESKQRLCALTCYHVVRSFDENVATQTDTDGIHPNKPQGHAMVEYPAAYDTNHTLTRLNNLKSPTAESQQLSSMLKSDRGIGRVLIASGYQINEDRRLDWALVETPTTFASNRPPPVSTSVFQNRSFSLPWDREYSQNSDSKVRNTARVRKGDWVTKNGRSTGVTSGEVNYMKRRVDWLSEKVTFEIEILSHDGFFVEKGDSGSMVTNADGELVGLLFASDPDSGNFDVGLMTPIASIQRHVKEMTGGGFISLED